jgi:5'(3')-deoxyribonucleotidase
MRVKLDMDGVLVNFTKAACKLLGEPYPQDEKTLTDYGWLFRKVGDAKCYSRLKGHHFWATLEKFPWADELIDIVDTESKGNWIFLTKPMIDAYCYSGKAEWIMKNYRSYLNKLTIIGADKSLLVKDHKDVLIDDHPKNVANWKEAGGSIIHWTELGDEHNPDAVKERLNQVRQQLIQIRES